MINGWPDQWTFKAKTKETSQLLSISRNKNKKKFPQQAETGTQRNTGTSVTGDKRDIVCTMDGRRHLETYFQKLILLWRNTMRHVSKTLWAKNISNFGSSLLRQRKVGWLPSFADANFAPPRRLNHHQRQMIKLSRYTF